MRCRHELLWCAALAACATGPDAEPPPAFELVVLGAAQDGGVPHLGCDRACCAAARSTGRSLYPVALGVHATATGQLLLVEATPLIEAQVALLHRLTGQRGRGRAPVDAILLTHAHVGHYLGLAWLGREVADARAVPVWVSARMAAFLRGNAPWRQLVERGQIELEVFEPGVAFEPLPGLPVVALPVPHRDELSDTVAFRFDGPQRTALFAPDVDSWNGEGGDLLERLLERVDVAFVDGTFYDGRELPDRDLSEIPHPPMVDTMQRLAAKARAHPGAVRFVHLNHTNPVLRDERLRRELEQRGFAVARRGDRLGL